LSQSEKCTKTLWFIQDKTSNQRTEPLIFVSIAYLSYNILSKIYNQ